MQLILMIFSERVENSDEKSSKVFLFMYLESSKMSGNVCRYYAVVSVVYQMRVGVWRDGRVV